MAEQYGAAAEAEGAQVEEDVMACERVIKFNRHVSVLISYREGLGAPPHLWLHQTMIITLIRLPPHPRPPLIGTVISAYY